MKKDTSHNFYLVREDILPEAIKKTIRVKEILKHHQSHTINEAVKMMDLSRSAYYKYKDHVAPAFETEKDKIVVLFLVMSDDFAVFNRVLRRIVKDRNEIISLNRGIPAEKLVAVTRTIKTEESLSYLQYLQETIKEMKGIQSLIFEARGELT